MLLVQGFPRVLLQGFKMRLARVYLCLGRKNLAFLGFYLLVKGSHVWVFGFGVYAKGFVVEGVRVWRLGFWVKGTSWGVPLVFQLLKLCCSSKASPSP